MLEKEEYRANLARVGRERSYYACYINLWGHLIDQLHSGQPLTEFPVGGSKPDVFTDDLAKVLLSSFIFLRMHLTVDNASVLVVPENRSFF